MRSQIAWVRELAHDYLIANLLYQQVKIIHSALCHRIDYFWRHRNIAHIVLLVVIIHLHWTLTVVFKVTLEEGFLLLLFVLIWALNTQLDVFILFLPVVIHMIHFILVLVFSEQEVVILKLEDVIGLVICSICLYIVLFLLRWVIHITEKAFTLIH